MVEIVPAILPQSREDLEDKLALLSALSQITAVQIDAVDGRFAAPACWPYSAGASHSTHGATAEGNFEQLRYVDRFTIDADLMVDEPERAVRAWSAFGASRLTVHAESSRSLGPTIAAIRATHGHTPGFAPGLFSLGLAVSINTDLALIKPHLGHIDYVQLMGIANIGKQSQPFDRRVIPKIHALRALDPTITIQIDGGVTLATAPDLLAAGANRLVVGHALWQAQDIAAEIAKFDALHVVE